MKSYIYESVGGPIECVPMTDVIEFLNRVRNRLIDIKDNDMPICQFDTEIVETITALKPL